MADGPSAEDRLRSVGLRITAPRVAALGYLDDHPHATADDVAEHLRAQLGTVATQTVYDVLRVCSDRGLLRRIEPAGSAVRYEGRVGDNHHHLVCRSCGRIVDVDCIVGAAPCLTPDDDHGFAIDEAEVTFWGQCADCR
ncbi:Ferric uptake regulator, Fur family OS=Tsukamurella paurometabola (strain ATCC 8368 / DSM /CCUG 35730 / CIP 100753 / JCM 10117 / KCTC 9821 / NBRC 16120/ NCIMB 702349 / NCTC 13040) OX=521096 GN=Tpau_3965 PE=3 SV=1 [Tsukamurella paurometabola]|uniref:Ferric uptake regulator, Fur family n=1 Tax=Tsukamurella paurometabola (strain ATCC 8368 / DSM 20162 / CCUG 35730 / CIP 100753 / JCM 10117 / KCTC 9821 / NBRC 16120 / NCIMB 702349 / NCTC 13040) TaxID=521096 RepID=D5UMR2_TSUPD|nr:Fur family transcriptional regulator [Tsukamurella paurometabola]ADG80536.1 ferric uptake regulator, Fur family [Tsukamurella paurometabola DSM 20162]SUP40009.1 Peroxide-responsive repressor perR [Tsukamurella paurometabola]